jgi:hypothetical protein
MLAPIIKSQPRSCGKVTNSGGCEDLTWPRYAADARSDDRRQPTDLARDLLALTGMRSGADLDAQLTDAIAHGQRATHGARGPVERGVETVARCVLLDAAVPLELITNDGMVPLDEFAPSGSPRFAAFAVDPTISVNSAVVRKWSTSATGRAPVRNSWISPMISS